MAREFRAVAAVRERVPLWIGLVGASGSGKTFSALRLATGMAKVYGDGVSLVDSEAKRSRHYADQFKFNVVDFAAPFGPLDYLAAFQHCAERGAKTIISDSFSHEWEGAGGVLEQHDAECDRLSKEWRTGRDKVNFSAWQRPKADHRRLRDWMIQSGLNFILCYRAREKLKVVQGKQPLPLGWQPIGADDMIFEATLNCLLMPGGKGCPEWHPSEDAERAMIKLPGQFEALFKERRPLDEATGEALARWAAGGTAATTAGASSPGSTTTGDGKSPAGQPPAGQPKASAASLEALSAQLGANGHTTKEAKAQWFLDLTGKPLKDATAAEVAHAIEVAETEASA